MKGVLIFAVLAITLTVVVGPPNRKANIRYVNSMPQFGRANVTAWSPQTLMFDQVPQGYITDYSTLDAQRWNFSTIYSTNATANSDEIDLDDDSYATVFTCQQAQRRLKNKLVYDVARSSRPNVALLRAINLAQYNYDIDVFNGTATLFNSISYCSASSYIQVPPADYEFDWSVSDDKRRGIERCPPNCTGIRTLLPGKAYTLYITPAGTYAVQDAKKNTIVRRGQSDFTSETAEATPVKEEREEKLDVTKEEKESAKARRKKTSRKVQRSDAQNNSKRKMN